MIPKFYLAKIRSFMFSLRSHGLVYTAFRCATSDRYLSLKILTHYSVVLSLLSVRSLLHLLAEALYFRRICIGRYIFNRLNSSVCLTKKNAKETLLLGLILEQYEKALDLSSPSSLDISSLTSDDLSRLHRLHYDLNSFESPQCEHILKLIQNIEFLNNPVLIPTVSVVILGYDWFMSIGHIYYLDSLFKGIVLGLVGITSVHFAELDDDLIPNHLFYHRYKKVAIDLGIYTDNLSSLQQYSYQYIYAWPDSCGTLICHDQFSLLIQDAWSSYGHSPFDLLTDEEIAFCRAKFEIFAGRRITRFITLHVRQPGYKNDAHTALNIRNCDPLPFYSAVAASLSKDVFCVVLGESNAMPVQDSLRSSLFDYPRSSLKSEIFDIYFICHSSLHIGTVSGVSHLTPLFGTPTLMLNLYSMVDYVNTIMVPRIIYKNGIPIDYASYRLQYPWVHYPFDDLLQSFGLFMPNLSYDLIFASIYSFIAAAEALDYEREAVLRECSKHSVFPSSISDDISVRICKVFYDANPCLFRTQS